MAHLVAPLAAGLADCPSGTVEFYRRGTTDAATAYSDFEATIPLDGLTLDAYGRKVCLVKEQVDVRVRRADGTIATEFPAGAMDAAVEIRSPSFTGTLPSGSQGLGGSTDLYAAFAKMYSSFGAADFKVRRRGGAADQNLKDALAVVAAAGSTTFDVTVYGAVGDGVTDDSGAIIAAQDAAIAAGGGVVYFPATADSYYIGAQISILSYLVQWKGAGMNCCSLTTDIAPTTMIVLNAAASDFGGFVMSDMTLDSGSSAAPLLSLAASPGVVIERCRFSCSQATAITVATRTAFRDCEFDGQGNGDKAIQINSGGASTTVTGCNFTTLGSVSATLQRMIDIAAGGVRVRDCTFDFSLNTAAATVQYGVAIAAGGGGAVIENNTFTGPSGLTAFGILLGADVEITEGGNTVVNAHIFTQTAATYESTIRRYSRAGTVARSASTTLSPLNDIESYFLTANNNVTVNAPTAGADGKASNGSEMTVWIYNSSGGNITITWNAIYKTSSTGNLATVSIRCIRFKYNAFAVKWEQVGGYTDYAA